jgi:hypothetical protein
MKRWIVLAAIASPLVLAGCSEHGHYYGSHAPLAVDDIRQRGYHDGFEAARRDVAHQSRPDMEHHGHFRHPPVPASAFEDYRHAFRAGYEDFLHRQ